MFYVYFYINMLRDLYNRERVFVNRLQIQNAGFGIATLQLTE